MTLESIWNPQIFLSWAQFFRMFLSTYKIIQIKRKKEHFFIGSHGTIFFFIFFQFSPSPLSPALTIKQVLITEYKKVKESNNTFLVHQLRPPS